MRRLLSLLLSAALVLTLASCGSPGGTSGSQTDSGSASSSGAAQEPVDIPFSLAVYPSYSLHPVLAENRANLTLSPLLYEPLFQLDETFQAAPVLCQSYTASPDNLSWTFTLRSGVTFSDGTPLTGEAVAATQNTARQAGSRYAQRLRDVTPGRGRSPSPSAAPTAACPPCWTSPSPTAPGTAPPGQAPTCCPGKGTTCPSPPGPAGGRTSPCPPGRSP